MPSLRPRAPLRRLSLALCSSALACGLFELDEDPEDSNSDSDFTADSQTAAETTGEPPGPPDEGFRVFPKYLLQDLPAIVTLDVEGEPMPCPVDAVEGGYLCDTGEAPGPLALIRVARDGFALATRTPELPDTLVPLDVHLYVEGGPSGVWSECVAAAEFSSCTEVCEAQMLGCSPASCATQDPLEPVATLLAWADPACVEPMGAAVTSCEDALSPAAGSVQCCCG